MPENQLMHQFRTGLLFCLALLSGSCRGARPAGPEGSDFLSISRPGSSHQARWSDVRVVPDAGGFRTDLFAKAASPREGEELMEVHFTLIRLRGPGEYPLGFGWDRGQSRVTIQLRDGVRCMTPRRDAGVVEVTRAPAGSTWGPGARLEGRYRVHCFPEGDSTSQREAWVFTGAFAVTWTSGDQASSSP